MDPTASSHLLAVASKEVAFDTNKKCRPCQSRQTGQPRPHCSPHRSPHRSPQAQPRPPTHSGFCLAPFRLQTGLQGFQRGGQRTEGGQRRSMPQPPRDYCEELGHGRLSGFFINSFPLSEDEENSQRSHDALGVEDVKTFALSEATFHLVGTNS